MGSQVTRVYLSHILPGVVVPLCLYFVDDRISIVSLFKIGLLFPLLILAMRGLTVYFPEENLRIRSLGTMVEYAILQGLVFAAFMVLFGGLMEPDLQSSLLGVLKPLAVGTVLMSTSNFFMAIWAQRKLRETES